MSSVKIEGNASGTGIFTIASPNSNTNRTLTLPDNTGTIVTTGSSTAITQSMIGTGVAGTGPAFRARMSGTQSPTANTWTKMQANSETFDTANCYDPTTNYRFTPNVAGYYWVCIKGANQNNATNYRIDGAIYKNGSLNTGSSFAGPANSSSYGVFTGSDLIYMNGTTDYLECYVLVDPASVVYEGLFSAFLARAA